MASSKLVFLTGLGSELVEEVLSYAPSDYEIVVLHETASEREIIRQVEDLSLIHI